ncbi:MAG: hypothetical protein GY861_21780 [bacterium]|nr:hypothetical protein [bacterium]
MYVEFLEDYVAAARKLEVADKLLFKIFRELDVNKDRSISITLVNELVVYCTELSDKRVNKKDVL